MREDNIKTEIGYEYVDNIQQVQKVNRLQSVVDTVMNLWDS